MTRAEFEARVKDMGKQRAAMFTCMTCADTARRWGSWEDDPRLAVAREAEWERGSAYWRARDDRGQRLKDELIAIAALIEAHRQEFDAIMAENVQRREWREMKAAMAAKPKPKREPSL